MPPGAIDLKLAERELVTDLGLAAKLRDMAGDRSRLTRHYDEVSPAELHAIVTTHLPDLEAAADELRRAAARLVRQHAR